MKTSYKVAAVTIVLGIIAFLFESNMPLGGVLWPPSPENPAPTPVQIPLLAILGLAEALSFGLGVAFLIFGWPLVRTVPMSTGWSAITLVAIAWMLINWFPHDSLHSHNGMNVGGLLAIEYGFHITLMIAGGIAALFFIRMATALNVRPASSNTPRVSPVAEPAVR